MTAGYDRESELKAGEYEENGISRDKNGGWLWKGREVFLLIDEDGSLCQNGSDEARDNKIYLVVKRNKDGSIKEVKQVTVEETMAEWILRDQRQVEFNQ